jgi:hypothetical protein
MAAMYQVRTLGFCNGELFTKEPASAGARPPSLGSVSEVGVGYDVVSGRWRLLCYNGGVPLSFVSNSMNAISRHNPYTQSPVQRAPNLVHSFPVPYSRTLLLYCALLVFDEPPAEFVESWSLEGGVLFVVDTVLSLQEGGFS